MEAVSRHIQTQGNTVHMIATAASHNTRNYSAHADGISSMTT